MADGIKMMFLSVDEVGDKESAIMGAALVTDGETKPLEFRCTNAIEPSDIQRILYGRILEQYIKVELIANPLLKSVKENPDIIIVKDSHLLEARPGIEIKMVKISVSEEKDKQGVAVEAPSGENVESGASEHVVFEAHKQFEKDKEEAIELLREILPQYNLLEPFERMVVALEQVHKQQKTVK